MLENKGVVASPYASLFHAAYAFRVTSPERVTEMH